ncbi:MAG: hypothetical protein JSR73_10135 [Proteobacteria bacterium]|nr:hypothetical protein [Pseudomonadota bacterium]
MSAWGKLHAAVLELAKSSPIKQRLTFAFSKHLSNVDATQLPATLRPEFLEIVQALEAVAPMPGESRVQATVRKMSAEDADLYAARIVVLFGEVARASTLRAVETDAVIEVPAARLDRLSEEARSVVPLLYAAEA